MNYSNKQPKFQKETGFYTVLKKRAKDYLDAEAITRYADSRWYGKAFFLIAAFVALVVTLYANGHHPILLLGAYSLMGFLIVIIGLNIGHDAAHGSISRHKKVNTAFLLVFDLIGANSYVWKLRHIHAHHPFPNVINWTATSNSQSWFASFLPIDSGYFT